MNITFIIGLLWMAFIVCSGPFHVSAMIYFLCPNHCGFDRTVTIAPANLLFAKSTLFILVFLFRIKEFRQMIRESLRCFRCRNNAVRPAHAIQVEPAPDDPVKLCNTKSATPPDSTSQEKSNSGIPSSADSKNTKSTVLTSHA